MRTTLHISLFFFNDTATTEIYTLSLHDALPIYLASFICQALCKCCRIRGSSESPSRCMRSNFLPTKFDRIQRDGRSEEHTSELQSHLNLVCRLLLEKKNKPSHSSAPLDTSLPY